MRDPGSSLGNEIFLKDNIKYFFIDHLSCCLFIAMIMQLRILNIPYDHEDDLLPSDCL